MKLISWNMAHRRESWYCLLDMDIDLALLPKAGKPSRDVAERIRANPPTEVNPAPWKTVIVDERTYEMSPRRWQPLSAGNEPQGRNAANAGEGR